MENVHPEDDNLDDLDDLLDEFEHNLPDEKPVEREPKRGIEETTQGLGALDEDFARQLQLGMSDLLKDLDNDKALQAQFESIVKDLGQATGSMPGDVSLSGAQQESSQPLNQPSSSTSFGDAITRTMERMKDSEKELDAAAVEPSADFLEEMLKQLQGVAGEGDSDGDGDFSQMLLNVMEQLTNKEILYEPMKDLHDKFPGWIALNESRESQKEMQRYKEQQKLISEIVGKFEEPSYSDESTADRDFIVDKMQKMQAEGNPPKDLMGDIGNFDGLEGDTGCPVQ